MSRLTIEIDPDQHRQIKTLATFEGKTIKDFILSRTLSSSSREEMDGEQLFWSERNMKRLDEAIATPDSENLVFENMEELKDALGI